MRDVMGVGSVGRQADRAERERCTFVLDGDVGGGGSTMPVFCNAPARRGSAYCPEHHARCHLAGGSAAESRKLREIAALAEAAGGRQARPAQRPAPAQLRRLDRLARAFTRPDGSRIVLEAEPNLPADTRKTSGKGASGRGRTVREADLGPTPERLRHGVVERVERPIGEAAAAAARPYRAIDTLGLMERRGSITAAMRQAGEDFRARFARAQLDPLRALDLSTMRFGERGAPTDSDGPGRQIEAARQAVWRAVQGVGGIASPGGSCLWHVVGWERSLKEWALEQGWSGRRVSQEAASGILVAALGALEAQQHMLPSSLRKSHL